MRRAGSLWHSNTTNERQASTFLNQWEWTWWWHSLHNYKLKLACLREAVRLYIFSQIWRRDKIVCVKRPGVWRMIHISRWHLCYNASFTSRLDMTPQYQKYFVKIECPDGQTIPLLTRQARVWLSNLSQGNYISGCLNHQSSHHFTETLTLAFSHKDDISLVLGTTLPLTVSVWYCRGGPASALND